VGQLFLKSGAQHLAGHSRFGFLLAAFRDAHVLSGLVAWTARFAGSTFSVWPPCRGPTG
jgi:hypothetical protein